MLGPEKVAEGIVGLAQYPRRTLHLGLHNALAVAYAVAPEATGRAVGKMMESFLLHSGPPAPATEGTLFERVPEGTTTRGGWRPDPGTATSLTAWLAFLSAVPIGLLAPGLDLGMRGRR